MSSTEQPYELTDIGRITNPISADVSLRRELPSSTHLYFYGFGSLRSYFRSAAGSRFSGRASRFTALHRCCCWPPTRDCQFLQVIWTHSSLAREKRTIANYDVTDRGVVLLRRTNPFPMPQLETRIFRCVLRYESERDRE